MKAQINGEVEKVWPIRKMGENKYLQEFLVVEPARKQGYDDCPFKIQAWAKTEQELHKQDLESYVGANVVCECYFNGYAYFSKVHGTQYSIHIRLAKIEVA